MITVIAVGRLKEKFYADAVNEYVKRLSAYTKVRVVETPDEKAGEDLSDREAELIKEKEAASILKQIKPDDYVVTLEIKGKKYTSEAFAELIEKLSVAGKSRITFVIGGSIGLAESVTKRADAHISFSDMTFPHQLMRVILFEQIYRAYKIIRKEPYHK